MKIRIMLSLVAAASVLQPSFLMADNTGMGNALVGPLFYTPLERDAIDRGNVAPVGGEPGVANDLPAPTVLRFDGRVQRSGGTSAAWVSGRPLERVQPSLPGTRLRLQGERLRIETSEATRWLKAGEAFEQEVTQAANPDDVNSGSGTTTPTRGIAPSR